MKKLSAIKVACVAQLRLLFFWILAHLITEHSKRSIFLTFIFMRLKDVKDYNYVVFSKMNDVCKLVSSVEALEMPALLIHYFFNEEIGKCSNLATCDFKSYAKEVLSKVPQWLRYDEANMRKDLLDIVKYCNDKHICVTR